MRGLWPLDIPLNLGTIDLVGGRFVDRVRRFVRADTGRLPGPQGDRGFWYPQDFRGKRVKTPRTNAGLVFHQHLHLEPPYLHSGSLVQNPELLGLVVGTKRHDRCPNRDGRLIKFSLGTWHPLTNALLTVGAPSRLSFPKPHFARRQTVYINRIRYW